MAEYIKILEQDNDIRLDRWFKRNYPNVRYGELEKMLRNGEIRVNKKRVKAATRVLQDQEIRLPPQLQSNNYLNNDEKKNSFTIKETKIKELSEEKKRLLEAMVLFEDQDILVINKKSGIPSQGGTNVKDSIDSLLNGWGRGKYYLVHRLDKDTSGCMVLAKSANIASLLSKEFSDKSIKKLYWSLNWGTPEKICGKIMAPLLKSSKQDYERVIVSKEEGKSATTLYRVVFDIGKKLSWLSFEPLSGRTHQIRVHSQYLECPIVGDFKYAREKKELNGLSRNLYLHARALSFRHPRDKKMVSFKAPLTSHMKKSWQFLGLDENQIDANDFLSVSQYCNFKYKAN